MKKTYFTETTAILFIFLFMYAATSKLMDYQKFYVQLQQSPLLINFAKIAVWMVPLAEIIISCFLATSRYKLLALFASFTLMVLFTGYIVAITRFSDTVPCSCGGVLSKMGWNQHLVFNIFFVALAALAIITFPNNTSRLKLPTT